MPKVHRVFAENIQILNDGPRLLGTNYWDTPQAEAGLFFLSTNAGRLRLLVPGNRVSHLPDMMADVVAVVLSRGPLEGRPDCVEIMFEDRSASPFAVIIDPKSLDRRWTPGDEGAQWSFAIYTQAGGEVRLIRLFQRCFLRTVPVLPWRSPLR